MAECNLADRTTVSSLKARKRQGRKITMLTAYDYPIAKLQDEAGIDVVFVGDSVGVNVLGYRSVQEVTMADIMHHARAVRRAVNRALFLVDMPFMSYQTCVESALVNAGRLIQEVGADAVKIEGGEHTLPQIQAIANAGIPTMGHLGFTPQSRTPEMYLHSEERGTIPKFHGKGPRGAQVLLDTAYRLQNAGIFALVLEQVTEEIAGIITERLDVPVIGIGAGRYCDGQVLTVNDVTGLNQSVPLLAKSYAHLHDHLLDIFRTYRRDVENGTFPTAVNVLKMQETAFKKFQCNLIKDTSEQ